LPPSIEPGSVRQVQPLHRSAQIGLGSLQLQMIMVSHQNVAVNPYSESALKALQQLQKMCIRPLVGKDLPAFHPPG
jgi:hypothetical protein